MKLMFIDSARPLSEARVRLDDGQELVLDGDGQCETSLEPGQSRVEILVDGQWVERTIDIEDSDKASMLIIDLSKKDTPTSDGLVGQTLGSRYRIDASLGHGGMGVVYRAWDTRLKRDVAVKTLNAQLRSNDEARRLFLQEARQMAPLSHPHLISIYDVTTLDGFDLMVTELVEGQDLDEILEESGAMSVNGVLTLGYQLTVAVAFLHEQGMIHRDLKPANAILETGGGVKLIDFGLARSMEHLLAKGTAVRGTPAYMAPEQVLGPGLTTATDVYQLGVTFYEMLTRRLPIDFSEGNILAQVKSTPIPIDTHRGGLPEELCELIHACLAREPDDRPTADEVATRLADLYYARTSNPPPSRVSTGKWSPPRTDTNDAPYDLEEIGNATTLGSGEEDISPDDSSDDDPPRRSSKRALVAVTIGGALLVLFALVDFVISDGGDEDALENTGESATVAEAPPDTVAEAVSQAEREAQNQDLELARTTSQLRASDITGTVKLTARGIAELNGPEEETASVGAQPSSAGQRPTPSPAPEPDSVAPSVEEEVVESASTQGAQEEPSTPGEDSDPGSETSHGDETVEASAESQDQPPEPSDSETDPAPTAEPQPAEIPSPEPEDVEEEPEDAEEESPPESQDEEPSEPEEEPTLPPRGF